MTITTGSMKEMQFTTLLGAHKGTFKRVNPSEFNSKDLVSRAIALHPRKVQTLIRTEKLTIGKLESQPVKYILDRLFCCDELIEVETEEGEVVRVCIDLTSNPNLLSNKESKLNYSRKLLESIGIHRSLVVYIDHNTPINSRDKTISYRMAGELLMSIEDLYASDSFVSTCILA